VLPFQAAVEGFCDPGFEPLRDAFRAAAGKDAITVYESLAR
jgi:hypothetical protein